VKVSVSIRWFLIPVLAIAGCSGVTLAAQAAGYGLDHVVSPAATEAVLPLDIRVGVIDGVAAMTFVLAGTMIAPRFRFIVALALYAVGACVAWLMLKPWWFPEGHPRAYQLSLVPLVLTFLGGFAGFVLTFVSTRQWSAAAKHSQGSSGQRSDQAAG
jgi:hypothetical protein